MATLVEKCWSRKPERKREGCFCQVNYGGFEKDSAGGGAGSGTPAQRSNLTYVTRWLIIIDRAEFTCEIFREKCKKYLRILKIIKDGV